MRHWFFTTTDISIRPLGVIFFGTSQLFGVVFKHKARNSVKNDVYISFWVNSTKNGDLDYRECPKNITSVLPLLYFYETIPHSRCRKLSKCTLRSDFSQFLFQKVKFTSTCESVHELPYLLIKLSVKYFISKLQRHHVQSVKNTSNQVPRRKESGKVRNFLYVLAIKNFFSQQRMISAFRSTTFWWHSVVTRYFISPCVH